MTPRKDLSGQKVSLEVRKTGLSHTEVFFNLVEPWMAAALNKTIEGTATDE